MNEIFAVVGVLIKVAFIMLGTYEGCKRNYPEATFYLVVSMIVEV